MIPPAAHPVHDQVPGLIAQLGKEKPWGLPHLPGSRNRITRVRGVHGHSMT